MTVQIAESKGASGFLRAEGEDTQRVTFTELFFDLVYVFAITQLSHLLVGHLNLLGAAEMLLLLLAVWWAWVYTAWFTNWFDPDRPAVRLLLFGMMLAGLLMSAALPEAFGERGLLFASAYVAIQVGRLVFAVAALGSEPALRRNFQRILVWSAAAGVLWMAGGVAHGHARVVLWLVAVLVDYAAPAAGFVTPGLGRSYTTDWTIVGGHLAERCQLFLIIAFGETILKTGATLGDLHFAASAVAAFVVAFVGSVALWWVYFDRSAEVGAELIAAAIDPGRHGRLAYTYFHMPMVAGVIVTAVADELTISHFENHVHAVTMAVILGGPALFLAGHLLFKWALSGRIPVSDPIAIGALALLVPVSRVTSSLALAVAATIVVVALAAWDIRPYPTTIGFSHS